MFPSGRKSSANGCSTNFISNGSLTFFSLMKTVLSERFIHANNFFPPFLQNRKWAIDRHKRMAGYWKMNSDGLAQSVLILDKS